MSKIIYNPKKGVLGAEKNGAPVKVPYGARVNGREDMPLAEVPKMRILNINEYKKFRDDVADHLLAKYKFLMEIKPEQLAKLMEDVKEKKFKCDVPGCDFETNVEVALAGHKKSHKLSPESEAMLKEIPEDEGAGEVPLSMAPMAPRMSQDNREGIPTGGTAMNPIPDSQIPGVGWYGPGVQRDASPSFSPRVRRGMPGAF